MNKLTIFYALSIMNMMLSSLLPPMDADLFMGSSKHYNLKQRIVIEKNLNKSHH